MTIYATVNGLLEADGCGSCGAPVWTLISPAGVLQGGNPYFVPDFSDRFEAASALAIRIGRLGKGIARRFAPRYVDSVAPALLFVASDLLAELRRKGLPWTPAVCYDRCLAVGRFLALPPGEIAGCRTTLRIQDKDGHVEHDGTRTFDDLDYGALIEAISRDNTLKTGDIILAATAGTGVRLRPGLSATLSINGEESLRFNIR